MIDAAIKEAFGINNTATLQKISTGLINHTYKLAEQNGEAYLLQNINTSVFSNPSAIQNNYRLIQHHLANKNSFHLPDIIPAKNGGLLFMHNNTVWRCFEYIADTFSPAVSSNVDEAWAVAGCFGKFSADLSDLNPTSIAEILPGFHDLKLRFNAFKITVESASEERRNSAKYLIEKAFEFENIVDFYSEISGLHGKFPLHILHHDCKIANILFRKEDGKIYSPIDLDTTQPGLYFSDLGDMIRSIVPNLSENETDMDKLSVRKDFYEAVKDGYLSAMNGRLTPNELTHIDMSGKIVVYMQALRFLTDYLNNDVYYQIDYPEQNKKRAENQFVLLALLNDYTRGLTERKIYI